MSNNKKAFLMLFILPGAFLTYIFIGPYNAVPQFAKTQLTATTTQPAEENPIIGYFTSKKMSLEKERVELLLLNEQISKTKRHAQKALEKFPEDASFKATIQLAKETGKFVRERFAEVQQEILETDRCLQELRYTHIATTAPATSQSN